MTIYFVLLFSVMFWIWFEKIALNRKAVIFPLFLLVGMAGSRNYLVGTDSYNYAKDFLEKLEPEYFQYRPEVEYGYQFLKYFLLNFTYDYLWLFLITSFIVVYSFLVIIKKYSSNYMLSVFTFICIGAYSIHFNILRQGVAISIIVLSMPYFLGNKKFKIAIFVIAASLFHYSSIIIILYHVITRINFIKLEYKIIGLFLSSVLAALNIITYLASVNDKYSGYDVVLENGGGYLTAAFYSIIALIVYIFGGSIRKENFVYSYFEQIYLYGVALVIPIVFLGLNPSGPLRLLYYSTWTLVFILPLIMKKFNSFLLYFLYIVFFLIYFYFKTTSFSGLVPYTLNETVRIF
ncbi:EpsG family protein [Psychrobacter celer]|uniref:EpsG family protein n=1 Tax=Psychrobacter celer TaxID=306572 RepID=UPI003FD58875